MSTCARCGLEYPTAGQLTATGACPGTDRLACRDREISNLRAQLRSVTRKVEIAHEELALLDGPAVERCRELLIQVLEALA